MKLELYLDNSFIEEYEVLFPDFTDLTFEFSRNEDFQGLVLNVSENLRFIKNDKNKINEWIKKIIKKGNSKDDAIRIKIYTYGLDINNNTILEEVYNGDIIIKEGNLENHNYLFVKCVQNAKLLDFLGTKDKMTFYNLKNNSFFKFNINSLLDLNNNINFVLFRVFKTPEIESTKSIKLYFMASRTEETKRFLKITSTGDTTYTSFYGAIKEALKYSNNINLSQQNLIKTYERLFDGNFIKVPKNIRIFINFRMNNINNNGYSKFLPFKEGSFKSIFVISGILDKGYSNIGFFSERNGVFKNDVMGTSIRIDNDNTIYNRYENIRNISINEEAQFSNWRLVFGSYGNIKTDTEIFFRNDLDTENFYNFVDYCISITFSQLNYNYGFNILLLRDILNSNPIKIISNSLYSKLNEAINNIEITNNKGLRNINDNLYINIYDLLLQLKKTFGICLDFKEDIIEIKHSTELFDLENISLIIKEKNIKDLKIRNSEEFNFNKITTGANETKYVLSPDLRDFQQPIVYENNSNYQGELNLRLDKFITSPAKIGEVILDNLFYDRYENENHSDDKTDDIFLISKDTPTQIDNRILPINGNFSYISQIANNSHIINQTVDVKGLNLTYKQSDIGLSVKGINTGNDLTLPNGGNIPKNHRVLNEWEAKYNTRVIEINCALTFKEYKTITENPSQMIQINYKGKIYFGFINRINFKVGAKSLSNIELMEANL